MRLTRCTRYRVSRGLPSDEEEPAKRILWGQHPTLGLPFLAVLAVPAKLAALTALATAAVLLATGCAGGDTRSEERPEWVTGAEPAAYPRTRYLIAVGSAESRESAQDHARAELARIFKVQVAAISQRHERLTIGEERNGGQTPFSHEQWEWQIETQTAATLRGVEFGETWRDPQSGDYHVLAVLERQRAASALREEMAALDRVTTQALEQADAATDRLRSLAALARGVAAQRQRAEHQEALRVLTGAGMPARYELSLLEAQLGSKAAAIPIRTQARGQHAGRVTQLLKAAVTEAGFKGAEGTNCRDAYRLEAELELDDLGQRDGWYWQRGGLTLRLLDPAGEPRAERRWPIRSAATDRATAERRALEEVAEHFSSDFRGLVIELATGQNNH
ncbi:hypothetical protein CKO15_02190 [Halorhodospira abdelmalekii]|uniref:LPP20 family lipoprotein n=1 Tax=Halorhodospira abdelmalekii TaxID=421629 RepID=UPI0019054D15|nr:LPP20 family lipoprotein [Halorhodospira abdelmalekii]MBK1734109.1 hypothetical protein [Halorhodospira abdelmalekii]